MHTLQLKALTGVPLATITNVFNEAFSDYFIPLQFTEESMVTKMKSEGITLPYSVGAFNDDQLVGFMLHAYDIVKGVKTIYNAGTGVIPAYRGNGITAAMYQYSIPLLRKEAIHTHLLEVIDTNAPAIKIYERAGFMKQRNLAAYKSTGPVSGAATVSIQDIPAIPSDAAFHAVAPAWQNSTASINRDKEGHQLIGAFEEGVLVGYAAFVPATARVKQLGVHEAHRHKGIGSALLAHIYKASKEQPIMITNVDESNEAVVRFLEALLFRKVLGLYEMKLTIPS